jgi:hypothetical protein
VGFISKNGTVCRCCEKRNGVLVSCRRCGPGLFCCAPQLVAVCGWHKQGKCWSFEGTVYMLCSPEGADCTNSTVQCTCDRCTCVCKQVYMMCAHSTGC